MRRVPGRCSGEGTSGEGTAVIQEEEVGLGSSSGSCEKQILDMLGR